MDANNDVLWELQYQDLCVLVLTPIIDKVLINDF